MNTGSVYENNIQVDASGNAIISGNLTVQGTTTTISTTNSVIADKLIELGNGTSGTPSGDAGIIVERGSSTNAGLIWDESADTWVTCTTSATGASTGDLTITDAALKASVITASTSLTLASGATVTAINDEDAMGSNSATALATQQSIKAYVDSQTSGAGNMDNWILEDDDGTEVTVSNGKEVKFIGSGLTTNFTDVSDGTDADPYDLTFTVDAAQTGITSVVNASLEIGRDADNRIKFGTDNQIIFEVDGGDNVIFKTGGEIEATSLDISGDADIDGTLEADAITLGGTALGSLYSPIAGSGSIVTTGALNSGSITSGFGSIDVGSSTISTTGTVTTGDVTIGGGDATLGTAGNTTATTISTITNTGTSVGKSLTISAGSTTTGSNNLNGGDLILASGGGDGTGTSSIQFKTKVSGTDAAAERMRIHTDGNVGIGTNAPSNLLHVAGADAYLTLQNTTAENGEGEAETRVLFGDHSGTGLAMIEGSHSGTADDTKGKFIISTNNGSSVTTALTIDDTQKAVFAGDVEFGGDTHTFVSANSEDPLVIIKNTTNDANGSRLRFIKDKGAAGADNDVAGAIEFYADDDNQDNILFGKIEGIVADASNGAEGGRVTISVASHDGEIQPGLIVEDGGGEDEVNVIIGNVTTSKTSVSGALGVRDTAPKVSLNVVHDYNTATFENQLADGEGGGRVLRYSPGADDTLTVGQLYFLHSDGTWNSTDASGVADGATQLLGIGLGNARTAGCLMEGFIRIPSTEILNVPGSGAVDGLPVYVSTTAGHLDFTAPSGAGDFVRIVGHAIDDDSGDVLIYFNPSNNHVEL